MTVTFLTVIALILLLIGKVNSQGCDGQLTYIEHVGDRIFDVPTEAYRRLTVKNCQEICSTETDDTGQKVPCQSFQFVEFDGICEIFDRPATAQEQLSPGRLGTYYEKLCVQDASAPLCQEASVFSRYPDKTLVGFADMITTANSDTECMVACFNAVVEQGFECSSGLYFSDTKECILNTQNRITHVELFADANNVVYFDNYCVDINIGPEAPIFFPWGAWESCSVTCGKGVQFRRRACQGTLEACTANKDFETRYCDKAQCTSPPGITPRPEGDGWGEWGQWGRCSGKCISGTQYRARACIDETKLKCFGTIMQAKFCKPDNCGTGTQGQLYDEKEQMSTTTVTLP